MKRKSWLAVLLAAVLAAVLSVADFSVMGNASAQKEIEVWVHGKPVPLSKPAVLLQNTTLVPLRPVAEALGAKVQTSGGGKNKQQKVTLTRGDKSAVLTIGSKQMSAAGRLVNLDVAPRLNGSVVMVPLRALSEALGAVVSWDSANRIVHINNPGELPVIGTAANLRKLAQKFGQGMHARADVAVTASSGSMAMESSAAAPSAGAAGSGFSTTNVQVEGVDEADWAKTDGKFIYQLSANRVMIVSIAGPSAPKLAATIEFTAEEGFQPQEMYVDGGRLVVIGQHNVQPFAMPMETGAGEAVSPNADAKSGYSMPYHPARTTVKTLVYSLDDKGKPALIRETEQEGNYVSSRKIGGALYVVTNKYNDMYRIMEPAADKEKTDAAAESFEPVYGDTASGSGGLKLKSIPLSSVRYFPESPEASTIMIGALDLDQPGQELQVYAYLGSGQTVYVSMKNLYVAITQYVPNGETYREETHVHKFRLDQGNVVYLGKGTVPGRILNQFSMDEYQGHFRIATTIGEPWGGGSNPSVNNLYVLDESLKTVGSLENLAPGERIYSTRFLGKRAYMVTFRNVDPLFAIDLTDPAKPAVLGQLKIPGYSDYLHPYDENHLIGFGKETIEISSQGNGTQNTTAFYQGLKIGLFDVTDPTQPKELFKEIIGDRGTHSELLQNHKALLFSKEHSLMAFPVDLMEIPTKKPIDGNGSPAYGQFTYQGAYVYGIDLERGFTLRGRVTHLSADDLAKSGQYGYDYSKTVRRILYAGDTLYTLSESMLKANRLDTLAEQSSVAYPTPAIPQK